MSKACNSLKNDICLLFIKSDLGLFFIKKKGLGQFFYKKRAKSYTYTKLFRSILTNSDLSSNLQKVI